MGATAAIITAIALVAAGVTAAVVLSKKPASVQPPSVRPGNCKLQAAAGLSTEPTGVRLMSTETTLAGGSTLALGQQSRTWGHRDIVRSPDRLGDRQPRQAPLLFSTRQADGHFRGGGDVTDVKKLYNALFEQFAAQG